MKGIIFFIFSIVAGVIFGIFIYLVLDGWGVKEIINSNPDIWEIIRVRGI